MFLSRNRRILCTKSIDFGVRSISGHIQDGKLVDQRTGILHRASKCNITSKNGVENFRRFSTQPTSALWHDKINSDTLPQSADVVVYGASITGAAVAYNLAKAGMGGQVVLLDQDTLTDGRAWLETSGLVGAFKPTLTQVKIVQKSIQLFQELTDKGLPTGWRQCGSLNLARTRDRMTVFRRMKSQSTGWGIECSILTPEQCKKIFPLLEVSDILGGLWIPKDGVADTTLLCQSLLREAQKMGVTIVEKCAIKHIAQAEGRGQAIETSLGTIYGTYFVNCATLHARDIGLLSDPIVKVPLHAAEHYFLHTKPVEGLSADAPVIRDLDGRIFFRENEGRILAGGYEQNAKPAFEDGAIPANAASMQLPVDWDHFHVLLEELIKRVPCLEEAVLERLSNVPEVFSPDGKWIVGESPEIQNYLVATGSQSVASAGLSYAIADIITQGYSSVDIHELDISRFLGLHNNRKFLRERVREVPGLHYAIPYPFQELDTGRTLRMSPIFPAFKEAGGVFGQTMGYERPSWFDQKHCLDDNGVPKYRVAATRTFGKPPWFNFASEEYNACREKIGLCDYSSFTKVDLWSKGREIVDLLQHLCSNDVDVPVGTIIHTGMQTKQGGYENDCSLARIGPSHYFMIAPTIQQTRCKAWIERHMPPGGQISLSDVTSMYTAICIMGPFSRIMLSELTDTDLAPKNFPFFTYRELDVGLANGIRAFNLTHTGELGFVLYIPNEFALHVYTRLLEAGEKYGIRHCGYYAMRALRVEKFFAFWGQDLDTFTTPLECGRMWRVKFDKPFHFIGRDALMKQRDEGVTRLYVQLLLNDHDSEVDMWPMGGEPIFRNGDFCGQITTASYGFTFKRQVCLGFVQNLHPETNEPEKVTNEYVLSGDYEIEIAGIRFGAKVNLHSPNLPTKYPDQEREAYKATRDKNDESSVMAPKPSW
uniref:Putative dimethylglycine dehydrogenase n=1 Tax=Lutzomyia longipalpis TaxID=7200 RepID=A0A1B0C9I4_LUTLO